MSRSARYVNGVLLITIDGVMTPYTVTDLHPDQRIANPAFDLTKPSGEAYHVSIQKWGPVCTCASFEFSKKANKTCKHLEACFATGLLKKDSYNEEGQEDS